ncbi:helix-turn-helix domain-containing protein [Kineothrix sp. MB12-C1]|uniref:helix-turn-helix domain-containing protein n=1 Tax=Kineothrix sp. MB12-C1 TaxID=3070215 RepID=UPI003FA52EF8
MASILRIGKTNTYKLVKRKDFPKVTIGKKILVKEEDLNNYLTKYLKNKITL